MATLRLGLAALALLVLLALCSVPVHADRAQVARRAHDALARRKRSDPSATCRPQPSSSTSPPTTPTPTPTPTPSPTPSPTSSSAAPSPTSGGSGKWGFAWGDDYPLENYVGLSNVAYIYNWASSTSSNPQANGLQYIPMLWGADQGRISEFQQTVVQGYASHVLGFNEPNEPSQSNLDPQTAAQVWKQYIDPLKNQGYYLISPACTNDDAGLTWYQQFFQACQDCQIDGVAFHAYTTSAQDAIDYATTLYQTYGKPIWITEFADQNYSGTGGQADMDEVWDFAGQIASFVDNTPWIAAAFPYGVINDLKGVDANNQLVDPSTGDLTSLAYYYFDS